MKGRKERPRCFHRRLQNLFLFILNVGLLIWVTQDAKRRGASAVGWGVAVFLLGPIGWLVYLFSRPPVPDHPYLEASEAVATARRGNVAKTVAGLLEKVAAVSILAMLVTIYGCHHEGKELRKYQEGWAVLTNSGRTEVFRGSLLREGWYATAKEAARASLGYSRYTREELRGRLRNAERWTAACKTIAVVSGALIILSLVVSVAVDSWCERRQLEESFYEYLVTHGGEYSRTEAATELSTSIERIMELEGVLRTRGRIE